LSFTHLFKLYLTVRSSCPALFMDVLTRLSYPT
jgi:hypothetical protein